MSQSASSRQIAEDKQSVFVSQLASKLRGIVEEITDIDRKLTPLKDRRKLLASERDRLRKLMYDTPSFETRTGSGQGLYVHTRYFMPYVDEWIIDYDIHHGGKGGQSMLAARANISSKNIRSYNSGKINYAGIVTVDRLLTAMGREDLMDSMPFQTTLELGMGGHAFRKETIEPPPSQYYED